MKARLFSKRNPWLPEIRVGFFLALRQVWRASFWTNLLIISVMTLTFLNLVVVSGILVGLIDGAVKAVNTHYLGDLFISNLRSRSYIERSTDIQSFLEHYPGVESIAGRYIEAGNVEANYKVAKRRPTDKGDEVGTSIVGIDPIIENQVTGLGSLLVEGTYLNPNDYDQVIIGALLTKKYLDFESPTFPVLQKVDIGDRLRITVNGNVREVTVKGILRSKVDEIDRRIFFVDKQLRGLIGRTDYNVDEIAVRLKPGVDAKSIKEALISRGFGEYATIQTQEEAEPKFLKDIKKTFAMLGTAISSIGLVVASITIFIVIFINAIMRRKFIGILKGIGIHSTAIEYAYVFQALFYAVIGTAVGVLFVFGFLKPYIGVHPINFPFSDGILVAPVFSTFLRALALFIATLIAGFIPVRLITRQNTLDTILNR